ncbi:hypothetical protein [Rhodococcus sp. NPDC004095]
MTSRDEFVAAMGKLAEGEGATEPRIEAQPQILEALGVGDGASARARLIELADDVLAEADHVAGWTGNSLSDFFLHAYALTPEDSKGRRTTLNVRRRRLVNARGQSSVALNTSRTKERAAINLIADHLGLSAVEPESGTERPESVESKESEHVSIDVVTRTKKRVEPSFKYWLSTYSDRVLRFMLNHMAIGSLLILALVIGFLLGVLLLSSKISDSLDEASSERVDSNPATGLSHAEFSRLPEAEQIDACVPIIKGRVAHAWNEQLSEGSKSVGRPAYVDEENPTANGLLNLTSASLAVIAAEPNVDTAQNLVVCVYSPATPQYHETVSLLASGGIVAPVCSSSNDEFGEVPAGPLSIPHAPNPNYKTVNREIGGWIEYGLSRGDTWRVWRFERSEHPRAQQASLAFADGERDLYSVMCEPLRK